MKILITRPQVDSERLSALVAARGHTPVFNPLLEIIQLDTPQPQGAYTEIVFTSAAAPGLVPESLDRTLPVQCVGVQTAEAARTAGFTHIISQAPTVEALLPALRQLPQGTTLLYPGGLQTSHDLSALLAEGGIAVTPWALYETRFLPLMDETIRLLSVGEVRWILLFSERTAEALMKSLPLNYRDWSGKVAIAAISARAAGPVRDCGWAGIAVGREATASAVLALCEA